ncbi:flagellar hook protein FlgE [Campylobacter sp. IFREMER_LSEM_CL1846]|uniref:flagellar hook protein FlgE n=1 Tax=Campylobacter sp. IFREMER_LSEM_CL1846 TaxID=2911614 RepID=UPI0021E64729|nr:flagellar hook protein FlgE [Campylobacter sp. IFREMER_LSEM_CL1846]HEC1747336.1 flagellar hook protein FlgE [Campylobacter lari]MCV3433702.1 flagellar hook protein FlgE [Campylobacter sp. IFREMER_LSEM_CL1846]HEC1767876.1 flagellar hook protein FlgE [Campylobacter lari]HEC1789265.1 flagellar hook protein FlgE [Campylobacter lari]HEC1795261.1 flagellar hook protein FlgE [Campylobacter lari]
MMRSLWAGVSGLQAHQYAMDVEGNNIANVNTFGFKYSRADFSTLMSQTSKIATAPDGNLGGKNPMQVGLGAGVNSTTRIHSQGNIQTTDKNTDMAINGDGFFIVSNDGGTTQYYTRAGDFKTDAVGNFVDNNGYTVQGWNYNQETGQIDSSTSVGDIVIPPGMSMPARPSSSVKLTANLDSGNTLGMNASAKRPIYALDSTHGMRTDTGTAIDENDTGHTEFYTTSKSGAQVTEKGVDMGVVFNAQGEGLNLRSGQGIWVSYADAKHTSNVKMHADLPQDRAKWQANTQYTYWGFKDGETTHAAKLNITINGVNIQAEGVGQETFINAINAKTAETGVVASVVNGQITFTNDNSTGTTAKSKNLDIVIHDDTTAGGQIQTNGNPQTDPLNNVLTLQGTARRAWLGTTDNDPVNGAAKTSVQVVTAHEYIYSPNSVDIGPNPNPSNNPPQNMPTANGQRVFHTTEDLRELLQRDARWGVDYDGDGSLENATNNGQGVGEDANPLVEVVVESDGRFKITNPKGTNSKDMTFKVTGFSDEVNKIATNDKFTAMFSALDGNFNAGNNEKYSQDMYLSAHTASIEIFDSLGTRHELTVQFTKQSKTADGGAEWSIIISVPEPAEINFSGDGAPGNIVVGNLRFGNDGSLQSYTPNVLNFTGNNGSKPDQVIKLDFGTTGGFDGLTSYDKDSATTKQETDGYTGGNLKPDALRTDENGYIYGEFTNGKTLALAKVALATFPNNMGLEEMGNNLYKATANSGTATIGHAGEGGRGGLKGSAIEMSNVDLSRALTELIVIQRGYQANSKTITTSDQLLNTLLQLKQ